MHRVLISIGLLHSRSYSQDDSPIGKRLPILDMSSDTEAAVKAVASPSNSTKVGRLHTDKSGHKRPFKSSGDMGNLVGLFVCPHGTEPRHTMM